MTSHQGRVHIGTSGWSYDHWQGVLYPAPTPVAKRLGYYVREFATVELNASFYHWPKDSTFAKWENSLPDNFVLTVKAPRHLTHVKKLKEPEKWMPIIERCWQHLQKHHGVLLVQLPPSFAFNGERLVQFCQSLPHGIKTAMEFRHPSWEQDETFSILENHKVAYCVMSGAHLPCTLRATTDFVYVRLHGPADNLYQGFYSDNDLQWWAARIGEWQNQGLDVFAYFNNDMEGYAVKNARQLIDLVN